MNESTSVVITIVNSILQVVIALLMEKVGYHTVSRLTSETMTAIFTAMFFNTAIVLMIADANFEYIPHLRWVPLHGLYPDFEYSWYVSIAPSLLFTMVINSVYDWILIGG